ncbi:sn-glycerol-1-phosphate dehydrogenase [Shouchella patagoniensis]|uniref:sn-glycerol-1-phosphate dehydrogenase n=1 Tax=Shouchella patagoniensis TaxID=228576 RepID=UPI001FE29CEC|nr:sn-glycerol-1-phosphate dehydrogenase [Shouchella patagoniensis]
MNMNSLQQRIEESGETLYPLPVELLVVEENALSKAAEFIARRVDNGVLLVADQNTHKAAGERLQKLLETHGHYVDLHMLEPNINGDVIADEASLVDVLLKIEADTQLIVAVGSGTIHDIVRFVSGKTSKPFVSIPTAPSVDGFTSLGAPIVLRGEKKTYQLVAPIALFADTSVLKRAPSALIAAGFGDMVGKYTSLLDWRIGSIVKGEPYSPLVAKLTEEALFSCVHAVDKIGSKTEEGVSVLMEGLLLSGLAMALFGYSHSASGAEHHLSHYWEMKALEKGEKQLLHGAKVGLSTLLINRLYKEEILPVIDELMSEEQVERVRPLIETLPEAAWVKELLETAGWSERFVPITPELINQSLLHAHLLRERYTLLRLYNDKKGGKVDAYRS